MKNVVDYVTDFESYLVNEKKSSKNTVESYMRDIFQFIQYCNINGVKHVTDINSDIILKYDDYSLFLGKSQSTVSRSAASLRCYFSYLLKKSIIPNNPMKNVKTVHSEKKLPEILTNDEIVTLLNQPDITEYKGCRDKAMLELLYATGIKVSELIDLKISDVNLQIGILHISLSKIPRILPMYPEAVKILNLYVTKVRSVVVTNPDEDRLFTNMNGQPMTRQGFWKIIKKYAESAGIKKDITPHTLRHSFAAHLLENGAQLSDIKEMLGHSDISSTQVYAQLIKSKYATAYKRFHPMAR